MRRTARASINHDALIHNFNRVKQLAPDSRIMAVIKADAYGHGMIQAAKALQQADGFAVACIKEAVALREAEIQQPVTVFQGFQTAEQLQQCIKYQLRPVIYQQQQIELLEQNVHGKLSVWFKVDTGMGRLGIQPDDVDDCWRQLEQCSCVDEVGLMSHFANADDPQHKLNRQQTDCFHRLADRLNIETSMCNSAGIIAFPDVQGNWVRPGIMLYGSSPLLNKSAEQLNLKPVMQLESEVIAINYLKKGDAVGYGGQWVCPEDMPVAVVAIGYGDGYPRHAPSGTPVSVNQQRTQLIGRVSMDMITIDLRNIDQIQIGDVVQLWGEDISVDEVAKLVGTIGYELLCHASGCRLIR
ncbi:MAG: alanine racemase [Gammaproteobacteria bacterium]|nr:alanine racemase [Gammaproteobacteria bacterium]MCW9004427.1 alanine racemase [Gammaproteobacteria bacterium]MCW9056415.1 alanine racemase [Gammaproteobacteria bacterium]